MQTSVRYTIQHRQDTPAGPMLEWSKSTNRTSKTAAGFCAVPMFANETELRKRVQPLLSAGNVDVDGLLHRAEAMVQRLSGTASVRAKNTFEAGNHPNKKIVADSTHSTVEAGQPSGSAEWSVVELPADSLEPVRSDSTGYALPVWGVGTHGGLPPHVWDFLASKQHNPSPRLSDSSRKIKPEGL